jgi:CCR4-NOT transcription complex subunit 1
MLQRLLVDLFQYMAPFLRKGVHDGQLPGAVRLLYKGSLRMLLVLLHDFPEFLASYHYALCDSISVECI